MRDFDQGTFVGRAWVAAVGGPALITVRDGSIIDITSREAPTMRDLMEWRIPRVLPGRHRDG